jgi:lipid-A-disaccharide synthase
VIVEGQTDEVLHAADVVVTASGTATVQTALHERPMVIVYRLSPLTYNVGRRFVRVSTFGMVNLIAGRQVVPELIQDAFTPERVAAETVRFLTDPVAAAEARAALAEVRARLGPPGASGRAAEAILEVARDSGLSRHGRAS